MATAPMPLGTDRELLAAHPGFTAVRDGIDHLEGSAVMPWSAEAIRLLDAQNDARGREIDRLTAVVARTQGVLAQLRTLAAQSKYAMYEAAFTDAAELLDAALKEGGR